MKHLSVRLLVVAGAICIGLAAFAGTTSATASSTRVAQLEAIDEFRSETWRWQSLMRKPRTPTLFTERRTSDAAYLRWVRGLWQRRAARAERQAKHPPHRAQWLCIHRYERNPAQGWRTHTGNGYFGGLQMDIDFQRDVRPRAAAPEGDREQVDAGRADVGRRAGVPQRARLLPLAEHRPLLRLDLILVAVVVVRAARSPLAQPDGDEDREDA